jgi:hypothetical protein
MILIMNQLMCALFLAHLAVEYAAFPNGENVDIKGAEKSLIASRHANFSISAMQAQCSAWLNRIFRNDCAALCYLDPMRDVIEVSY